MRKVIKRLTGEDGEGELCLQLQIFQILAIIDSALGKQILALANTPVESSEIVPNKEEETILEDPEKDKGKGKARATVVPNPRFLLEQVCRAKPGCFPKGGPATRALLLK